MTPLGQRVVIRPATPAETTDSGLILVRESSDPDVMGEVVALGTGIGGEATAAWQEAVGLFEECRKWGCYDKPGCDCPEHGWRRRVDALLEANPVLPADVKVGDTVLFPATGGQDIVLDGERFIVLPVGDILAVIEPDQTTEDVHG